MTAANTNRAAPIRAATETATLDANGTAPFTATETAANHRDRNRAATARERFSNPVRGGGIGNEREIVLNSSEPRVGIDGPGVRLYSRSSRVSAPRFATLQP